MPTPSSVTRDAFDAALFDRQHDAERVRIEAVFDQLFDDRRRALHHLPGRNLIGDKGGEPFDSLLHQLGGVSAIREAGSYHRPVH